jgi:RNA polymerase sigma factor (sigma-70 family)
VRIVNEPAQATSHAPNGWSWTLLEGFRQGTQDALREVYRQHADAIARQLRYGFSFSSSGRAHRFVGYASAFELHDALHETFARAFEPQARLRYDGIRPYGPYLKAIARNVVLRAFRAREISFPMIGEEGDPGPTRHLADAAADSPEQIVGRRETRELVQGFLQTLEAQERTLLRLRFVEGKSQRDVAGLMGLGRQQVRSREEKLRERLVRYLRSRGEAGIVPAGACLSLLVTWATMAEGWR